MYCRQCGNALRGRAKFCPKCGTAVSRKATPTVTAHAAIYAAPTPVVPAPKKNPKLRIVALALCAVLVLGIGGGIFACRSMLFGAKDVYTAADTVLEENIVSSNFQNADLEERKEIAMQTLDTLEQAGNIEKDSVSYSDPAKAFTFHYPNGAEGEILLQDIDDGEMGFGNTEVTLSDGTVADLDQQLPFDDITPYEGDEVRIAVLYGAYNNVTKCKQVGLYDNYKDYTDFCSENHVSASFLYDTTAQEFKTILCDYDFIHIAYHGPNYTGESDFTPTIYLLEACESKKDTGIYAEDLQEQRLRCAWTSSGGSYVLNPSFFSYYYADGKLNNKIIWLAACNGFRNDRLVSALDAGGAKAVIASTQSISIAYDVKMLFYTTVALLYGTDVDDALSAAKSILGNDNVSYLKNAGSSGNGHDPAEVLVYRGTHSSGDATLVTLTDAAKKRLQHAETAVTTPTEAEETLPSMVQAVLEQESTWLDKVNTLYRTASDFYGQCNGWFQDLDMDGTPEFIVGGAEEGRMGIAQYFIFYWDNGTLQPMEIRYSDTSSESLSWNVGALPTDAAQFPLYLYQSSEDGAYYYLSGEGSINGTENNTFTMSRWNVKEENGKKIFYCSETLFSVDILGGELTRCEGFSQSSSSFSPKQFLEDYENFFATRTMCRTTTLTIPCSDLSSDISGCYDAMTKEEKKQALLRSYTAWAYTVDSTETPPLQNVIENVQAAAATETTPVVTTTTVATEAATTTTGDWKSSYKAVISEFHGSFSELLYTLYDMDQDGVPELIVNAGSCEGDKRIYIYTYKNGEQQLLKGDSSGWHIYNFYKDTSNQQLVAYSASSGYGTISRYTDCGESIAEERVDFDYTDDPESVFLSLGTFEKLATAQDNDLGLIDRY
jgi:hypothetical protein